MNLSKIDADVHAADDQAYQIVSDFTGTTGQLVIGPNVWGTAQTLMGDTNEDGVSNFEITLLVGQGLPCLTLAYFSSNGAPMYALELCGRTTRAVLDRKLSPRGQSAERVMLNPVVSR